jgi:chromatin remodeling complex protein RSC6
MYLFNAPSTISSEMCEFMGLPFGSKVSRLDAVKVVMAYCKEHGLLDGKVINPDAALNKLFGNPVNLTILNLTVYLKPHFIKPAVSAEEESEMSDEECKLFMA